MPYVTHLTPKVINILKPFNVQIAHQPQNQIRQLYTNLKSKIPIDKRSHLVYSIPCKNCDKVYIGRTAQRLQGILKGHKYAKTANTALNKHKQSEKHDFDYGRTRILTAERNLKSREMLDMIFIQMNIDNTVNNKTDIKGLSSIYTPLL
ncbi:hypothetical protein WA026_022871 [Henosepilachna vigintioctopunctata]|uniref:GIY-YIG domain-containing protein n=1 Tax=Henosepilachna vigintioctopunctata TaxID=420089 RepID=A0AAW1UCD6_9CUCU